VTYPYLCRAPPEWESFLVSYNYGTLAWWYNAAKMARIAPGWLEERGVEEDFRQWTGRLARFEIGSPHSPADVLCPTQDNDSGLALEIRHSKGGTVGSTRNFPLLTKGRMEVRFALASPEAFLVWHSRYQDPASIDDACLRIRFLEEGQACLGAGVAEDQTHKPRRVESGLLVYRISGPG